MKTRTACQGRSHACSNLIIIVLGVPREIQARKALVIFRDGPEFRFKAKNSFAWFVETIISSN